jgi:hypothetical protein
MCAEFTDLRPTCGAARIGLGYARRLRAYFVSVPRGASFALARGCETFELNYIFAKLEINEKRMIKR